VTAPRRAAPLAALALVLAPSLAPAEGWTAPPEARAKTNPVPPSPEAMTRGKALYQRHCSKCHGPKGRGDGSAARYGAEPASDLTAAEVPLNDGEVFWKISTGRKSGPEILMPAFTKDIPKEEDRWKVVHFVRLLVEGPARPSGR
jgi:mono/diheme cytochrome c family protein